MPRWLKYTGSAILVAFGMIVAVPQTNSQSDRQSMDRDAALPALAPNQLRVVPPTPRVRISDDGRDQPRDPRDADRSRRRGREFPAPEELSPDRPTRPARSSSRTSSSSSTRASRSSSSSTSSSSDSSGTASSTQTFRRAVGDEPDHHHQHRGPIEYGRLIVMTQSEGVRITIAGQPYPFNSMDGVLLYANEQYEVVLEQAGEADARASSAASQARVITVRVGPGETRVLLANLGSGTTATPPPRSRRASSRSRSSASDDDDDEEIGYLGVSSSPRGTVYVDDENTGQTTPARRIQLEPGRHEVRIFYESEERFSETKNVLIREGVNTNVFFRMRRDEEEEE